MSRRIAMAVCAVALAGAALTACSSSSSKGTAESSLRVVDLRGKASTGEYPEVKVEIRDNDFTPAAIRVDPGVTVSWHNRGRSVHNLEPVDANQSFGNKRFGADAVDAGKNYEYRFQKPGVYRYYCSLHGSKHQGMIGMVVVGDVAVGGGSTQTTRGSAASVLHVGAHEQYRTIQSAVDASAPGALVLIGEGVYHEAVTVDAGHENITIRGVDRNRVVLDGQFDKTKPNGFLVQANGVAIENLSAKNYTTNSFFWRGVKGYRGSYLTSYRTGDYGIYAFDSTDGQFDHDYAAGSRDAGFYIGQCFPCNAVITDSVAEWNGLGYSGTNAGGNLLLVNSTWRFNRAGIVPNSETGEELYPQREATIVGNRVYSNNNVKTPAIDIATTALGNGILVAGGRKDFVERNLVYDHDIYGIGAIPLPEKVLDPSNTKAINFDPKQNTIRDNDVSNSRVADLALVASVDKPNDPAGTCFSGNTHTSSSPADIETLLPCDGTASAAFKSDLATFVKRFTEDKPKEVDYRTSPLPPMPTDLDNMPDPLHAPARPAKPGAVPMKIDLASIERPTR